MTFINKPFEEEEENNEQQGNQPPKIGSSAPTAEVGDTGGAQVAGEAAQQGAAPAEPQKTSSGAFTNLNKFLTANEGRVSEFGNQLAGAATEEYNKAESAIDSELGSFQGEVEANTRRDEGNSQRDQILDDTTDLTDDEIAQYNSFLGGDYAGPDQFTSEQGYADIQDSAKRIEATDTNQGREAFFDNLANAPETYTSGQRSLDSLLLQRDQSAQDTFANLRERLNTGTAQQKIEDTSAQAAGSVDAARVQNQDIANRYAQGLQASQADQISDIDAAIQAQEAANLEAYNKYVADNSRAWEAIGGVDASEGYSTVMGGKTYLADGFAGYGGEDALSLDAGKYATLDDDVSYNEVITPEQQARMAALQRLSGASGTISNNYSGEIRDLEDAYSVNSTGLSNEAARLQKLFEEGQGRRSRALADRDRANASVADLKRRKKAYRKDVQRTMGSMKDAMEAGAKVVDFLQHPDSYITANNVKVTLDDILDATAGQANKEVSKAVVQAADRYKEALQNGANSVKDFTQDTWDYISGRAPKAPETFTRMRDDTVSSAVDARDNTASSYTDFRKNTFGF